MTLANQLKAWLAQNWEWHPKGKLTADMVWKHTHGKSYGKRYLPETVGRALRSLEEHSLIAVKDLGISVQYKWLPLERRASYIPSSQRGEHTDKLFNSETVLKV